MRRNFMDDSNHRSIPIIHGQIRISQVRSQLGLFDTVTISFAERLISHRPTQGSIRSKSRFPQHRGVPAHRQCSQVDGLRETSRVKAVGSPFRQVLHKHNPSWSQKLTISLPFAVMFSEKLLPITHSNLYSCRDLLPVRNQDLCVHWRQS